MSKIATYSLADTPLQLSDRLIGTEAPRTPPTSTPLATKNFSLGELLQLFSSNFPAATLQEVLDEGNVATEDIFLTGTIESTVIKPTNIEDVLGSQGATFQFLSKAANGINWVNLPTVYPTLNDVLTAGNVSTLDAKIGELYLWDTNVPTGYAKITGDNSRINFVSKSSVPYGYITSDTFALLDSSIYSFKIKKPAVLSGNHTATFQDTSGTVAYIADIPSQITLTTSGTSGPATLIGTVLNVPDYSSGGGSVDLDAVLANGNTSSNYIVLTETGLDTYSELRGNGLAILDSVLPKQMVVAPDGLTYTSDGANYSNIEFVTPTKANTILFQDNSGTLAFLSDIPAVTGYVPYTGATQNVDLGEFEIKAGQMTLDVSPTGTATVGTTVWNNTIGSSQTTLKGGTVILKNGVDLVARVVNKVTPNATLLRSQYKAVRISGAQGQRLAIAYAQANNDTNSADTIGLVCEDIATNQEGFIITVGQLLEINTTGSLQGETWADGDVIYLSPTIAGSLTNVKPNGSTGHIVVIGYVEYAHAIHGSLYVKVMNGWELDELHNVYINTPLNNQGIFYNSTSQLWENKSIVTALGYTPEDVANKQTDLTASATKYPTVDAVNTGLATKQNALSGTGFVKISGTTISYDNSTYLTSSTVITEVEKNSIELRANGITLTTFTRFGYSTASDVTSGVAAATSSGSFFGIQNRFNYTTSTVAGSLAFFRTTFGSWGGMSSGRVCEWLFGTADAATVAGARSFVGFTGNFAAPTNVEPTTLVSCVGLARLSTSNNWHIIHNDASGTCTSIDLGSGYPSNTLEVDLIYLRLTFNTNGTISYLVANKTTNISTSGVLSTNLPAVALYEQVWTCNNATALAARLGFCYRTFSNP